MAGIKKHSDQFKELVSPYLRQKIAEAEETFGPNSRELHAITNQYFYDAREKIVDNRQNRRHYEAEMHPEFDGQPVLGIERLYRRTILIEPTLICAAHCRWCLRGFYPAKTMKEDDITHATRYIGSKELRDDVDEVLMTGGDPLMSLPLLALTLGELTRNAPNIKTVRIGSRVPFQDPRRINDDMISLFNRYSNFKFEIGVNVCHPIEFWPESVEVLHKLQNVGIRIYNQHPLLKGVNDDYETLNELYDLVRQNGVEGHYLFHAIPIRGAAHHRTTLMEGARLASLISSSGKFSGRTKPHYAVLSDIGKIVMYEGTILKRREEDNAVLLQSGYRLEERLKWNPNWVQPESVEVDENGFMRTWYLDAAKELENEIGQDTPDQGKKNVVFLNGTN